jgi:hypothetical protein
MVYKYNDYEKITYGITTTIRLRIHIRITKLRYDLRYLIQLDSIQVLKLRNETIRNTIHRYAFNTGTLLVPVCYWYQYAFRNNIP